MSKLSAVEGKLSRIHEQISEAREQIVTMDCAVDEVEAKLTNELAKERPDDEGVAALETQRGEFTRAKRRFKARIIALESILPANEEAANREMLQGAIEQHQSAVAQVNTEVSTWRKKAKALKRLAEQGKAVLVARKQLGELVSKIQYLSALLGKDPGNLQETEHLTNGDIAAARGYLATAIRTTTDAYSMNQWDEKLRDLNAMRRAEEKQRAVRA